MKHSHVLSKESKELSEAIKSFETSFSLKKSWLGILLYAPQHFESFEEMKKYLIEELQKSDFYLSEDDETEWIGDMGASFRIGDSSISFATCSGINAAQISPVVEDGEVRGYKSTYTVESWKPREYSSSIKAFEQAGWNYEGELEHFTDEELEADRRDYEDGLINAINRLHSEQPGSLLEDTCGLDFYFEGLSDQPFTVSKTGEPIYSIGAYNLNGAGSPDLITLVKHHPELIPTVKAILKANIKNMESVELPLTYEFNDTIYTNSTYYRDRINKLIEAANVMYGIMTAMEKDFEVARRNEAVAERAESDYDRKFKDTRGRYIKGQCR